MNESNNPMNILQALDKDLTTNAINEMKAYESTFNAPVELTPEERQKIDSMDEQMATVVHDTNTSTGETTTVAIRDYAKSLDERVVNIAGTAMKTVNQSDIVRSEIADKVRAGAMEAFKTMAIVNKDEYSDDMIIDVNRRAMDALRVLLGKNDITVNAIYQRFNRQSLRTIVATLPKDFVSIYVSEDEISRDSIKAKDRLLSALAYICITGPELDNLNNFIADEHKLINVSTLLIECQANVTNMLTDPKTISEVAEEAAKIYEPDHTVWSKYIVDPKRVHNEFAQASVVYRMYKDAYEELKTQNPDNVELHKAADAEITECDMKIGVYSTIADMTDLKDLWNILANRMLTDSRFGYSYLVHEAKGSLERIYNAKQDLPVPVYVSKAEHMRGSKNDQRTKKDRNEYLSTLFNLFVNQYPVIIGAYNKKIRNIMSQHSDAADTDIVPISIDGIDDRITAHYYDLILMVLFGRVVKRFADRDKFAAIKLDAYFQCYCKMFTDIYMSTYMWNMMKSVVEHAIRNWPIEIDKVNVEYSPDLQDVISAFNSTKG